MIELILGIIHICLVIWAIFQILGAKTSGMNKFLWILLVAVFPLGGLIIYLLFGPRK